jgi:hypothetical protein
MFGTRLVQPEEIHVLFHTIFFFFFGEISKVRSERNVNYGLCYISTSQS